ncbi:adenylate/guanylate cyclase domain-containing protein [Inquilinus sp. YAF38]|uniref:adenylate/guanylate cyclase domain-containing protein n=1 Tax=Inquilinus sp. YAF38 TaxID=3233084 RepID=UPI003F9251C3
MNDHRKLAAILAADVVGFSRLAGADEDRTLARLRALRSDLIDPTIAVHQGRVVKRTGDGSLVEFRSVVDAVRCAIEVQRAMVERNAGVPEDRRIVFRIGIHLGDVVEESDGDLMGDGVNIASRLQSVAAPGTICLSEDAYRQVKTRLDLSVSDLGSTQLKNITDPMRIYSLQVAAAAGADPAPQPRPAAPAVAAAPSGKPSIAVLPFTNMSGDPEQEYFVDGMVEDIITALSRFNQLAVIARNSTFIYKGRAVDVRQVARELGVRYVLEGGVRKSGNRLRITGQLVDAATGAHLWAERFDGDLQDVFDLQDKITASVVGAIEPTVLKAEIERARRKPAENLDAYDLYLQALPHVYAMRPDENLLGYGLLTRAVELEPSFAPALAHAAWCLEQRLSRAWPAAGADDLGTAVALARRAAAAGSDDPLSMALAGFVLVMAGRDYGPGLDGVRRAVERNPGSGQVNFLAGTALTCGGDPEAGLVLAERAMALGPLDPSYFIFLTVAGLAHLFSGRPAKALELAQRSAALNPGWDSAYWALIPACVQLDRLPEAQAALGRFLPLAPGMTVSALRECLPLRDATSRNMVLDGFRTAGLPE